MKTEKQARIAGEDAGATDAETLFREMNADERARVSPAGWGWDASEAALVLRVPARFRRAFEEAYETGAALAWETLTRREAQRIEWGIED